MNPEKFLKQHWGYSGFRSGQLAVINSIISGNDTLALLPTGGGKSICYQVPGLMMTGITLVISPLISLMKDQVDGLNKRHISATYLASSLSNKDLEARIIAIKNSKYRFVYVSPEKLLSNSFIVFAKSLQISLVIVDEAHCISLWGTDFRPSYLQIPEFISHLPSRPVIAAFTATATTSTKQDIISKLELNNVQVFQSSFKRNISLSILTTSSLVEHELQLLAYLKNAKYSGIIYTSSRRTTERLAWRLNSLAHLLQINTVGYYHAGLSSSQRLYTQQQFIENDIQVLVATTAFGMGIDKPNIQFVVHYHPPASLEGYFQEIGRAGRNGQQASALLLFNHQHLQLHQRVKFSRKQKKDKSMLEDVVSYINSPTCLMQHLLAYFSEHSERCGSCNNCIFRNSPLYDVFRKSRYRLVQLEQWSKYLEKHSNIPSPMILSPSLRAYLVVLNPQQISDFALIPGIGKGWLEFWGPDLLAHEWYNTQASTN